MKTKKKPSLWRRLGAKSHLRLVGKSYERSWFLALTSPTPKQLKNGLKIALLSFCLMLLLRSRCSSTTETTANAWPQRGTFSTLTACDAGTPK